MEKTPSAPIRKIGEITSKDEYTVVTILVSTSWHLYLPSIKNKESLQCALNDLRSYRVGDNDGVEVLWTPQNEDDVFSLEELRVNYPRLNSI